MQCRVLLPALLLAIALAAAAPVADLDARVPMKYSGAGAAGESMDGVFPLKREEDAAPAAAEPAALDERRVGWEPLMKRDEPDVEERRVGWEPLMKRDEPDIEERRVGWEPLMKRDEPDVEERRVGWEPLMKRRVGWEPLMKRRVPIFNPNAALNNVAK